jgi:hypothetical protein
VNRIAALAALAAAVTLGGCSYSAESSFLGYRSSISYSTPGRAAPPPPPSYSAPPAYSPVPTSPPPGYRPPASCYRGGFYNRWGYWVPGRYAC